MGIGDGETNGVRGNCVSLQFYREKVSNLVLIVLIWLAIKVANNL